MAFKGANFWVSSELADWWNSSAERYGRATAGPCPGYSACCCGTNAAGDNGETLIGCGLIPKNFAMDNDIWVSYNFHLLWSIIPLILKKQCQIQKPFFTHRPHINKRMAWTGSRATVSYSYSKAIFAWLCAHALWPSHPFALLSHQPASPVAHLEKSSIPLPGNQEFSLFSSISLGDNSHLWM